MSNIFGAYVSGQPFDERFSLNSIGEVRGFLSLKDAAPASPPDHLPADVMAAFVEAVTCQAVQCYNAAGAMFRLCLDLATQPLRPDLLSSPGSSAEGSSPNKRQRRDLGLRLQWLLSMNMLPAGLTELASCIREDGNDGAYAGNLSAVDVADIYDFTIALLERLFTEPRTLELARQRRLARRQAIEGPTP